VPYNAFNPPPQVCIWNLQLMTKIVSCLHVELTNHGGILFRNMYW
jgi:hypothetical protein